MRFLINCGFMNKNDQPTLKEIKEFVAEQTHELEMVSQYNAEDLVDQIDEYNFYQQRHYRRYHQNDFIDTFLTRNRPRQLAIADIPVT